MNTEGKVWGRTTLIAETETASVHALEILAGGFSSMHRHRIKKNIFHVLQGAVKITKRTGEAEDETTLHAGDSIEVEAGTWHKFEALKESRMIEVYTVELERPDIEREGSGGIHVPEDRDPKLQLGMIDSLDRQFEANRRRKGK
jgi:quercetin dioxygenase-like cupin family protein